MKRALPLVFLVVFAAASACRTTQEGDGESQALGANQGTGAVQPSAAHVRYAEVLKAMWLAHYTAVPQNYVTAAYISTCAAGLSPAEAVEGFNKVWAATIGVGFWNTAHATTGAALAACGIADPTGAATAVKEAFAKLVQLGAANVAVNVVTAGYVAGSPHPDAFDRYVLMRKKLADSGVVNFVGHDFAASVLSQCPSGPTPEAALARLTEIWGAMLSAGYLAVPDNAPAAAVMACKRPEGPAAEAVKELTLSFKMMGALGFTNIATNLWAAAVLVDGVGQ